MIRDGPIHGDSYECDVCIIGSGPAGMIVAAELSEQAPGVRICVVESGRRSPTPFADALRDLHSDGIPVEAATRERVFGGASSTWAGLSSPLQRIDFEHRPWVRHSGWPFGIDELMPWYARVAQRYRFPDPELFDPDLWCRRAPAGDLTPSWRRLTGAVLIAPDAPFRFGPELQTIFEREHVDLLLDATVLRLTGERRTGRADCVIVRSAAGSEARVCAQLFVIACGGIENARLLLLSTYAGATGLGNAADQVGRHLMNHPKADFGYVLLNRRTRALPAYFGWKASEYFGSMGLRLAESVQEEAGVLNSYLRFRPVYDWSDAAEAGAVLARRSLRRVPLDAWRGRRALLRYLLLHRRADADAQVKTLRIRNFMEMAPDPTNRVTLGRRRDVFGSPLARVHHDVGRLDRLTMQRLHDELRAELRRQGWGRLESVLRASSTPWPIAGSASHHMGSTRMGSDAATSVVDPHCRVHDVSNVYIAGASLFPTGGSVNPTFTLAALSARLARHIAAAHFAAAAGAPSNHTISA